MWNDPIVEETRKLRDEYAAKHDYDVHRIAEDLRQWQKAGFPVAPELEESMQKIRVGLKQSR